MASGTRAIALGYWIVALKVQPLLKSGMYYTRITSPRNYFGFGQEPNVLYRQLAPIQNKHNKLKLLQSKQSQSFDFLNGFPRTFFWKRDTKKKKRKRVPKLILLQNPLTWLMIKIDFSVLRNIWDQSFHEKDFRLGTKQVSLLFRN